MIHNLPTLSEEVRMTSDVYSVHQDENPFSGRINPSPDTAERLEKNAYTWSGLFEYAHLVNCFVIQRFIRQIQEDMLVLRRETSTEFTYDYQKKSSILIDGSVTFTYRGKVYVYAVSTERGFSSNTLTGTGDISELVEKINHEIRWHNPLRNRHVQIIPTRHGYECFFKKAPTISLSDVIIDDSIKEDILDQTILHFETIEGNNGIILHGKPGTGKSLCCQAIISEALKRGYSTCFLTSAAHYSLLNEFLSTYFAPCIVVLEDLDSFGESRSYSRNPDLSDFLQFLSGLSESDEKIVFIGTTNHIEFLDDAIADRPVRFNRKYKFDLPSPKEINRLVDLYFKDEVLSDAQKALCYNKGFTGSHIKEVQRTAKILMRKRNASLSDVFQEAVQIVSQNFYIPERKAGFHIDD